jgi:hypothetical protein
MTSSNIIPFPSYRRRDLVRRHAAIIASLSTAAGERHLRRQLLIQAEAMARRGISAERIKGDQRALEAAIRAALCRLGCVTGGAG